MTEKIRYSGYIAQWCFGEGQPIQCKEFSEFEDAVKCAVEKYREIGFSGTVAVRGKLKPIFRIDPNIPHSEVLWFR